MTVSFRETLPLHVSQNKTIFCNQNVIAKLWPTRVYYALLSVAVSHSGRHCLCMSPRMEQCSALITWTRKFDRQTCIVHSCRSACRIPGDIVTACLPEWDNLLQSECDCKTLSDKSVLCTLVGHSVSFKLWMGNLISFWETCSDNVSRNETLWPTRVHNTLNVFKFSDLNLIFIFIIIYSLVPLYSYNKLSSDSNI